MIPPCQGISSQLLVVYRTGDHNVRPVLDAGERLVQDGSLRGVDAQAIDPSAAAYEQQADWQRIFDSIKSQGTELVLLQHFHSPSLADVSSVLHELKALPHRPVVALTNGDAFFNGFFRPSFPSVFLRTAESVDIVFSTSMGISADYLFKRANARMSLLPNGACQVRFGDRPQPHASHPRFRVVFIGSNNRSRNPMKTYHWYGRRRERLIRKLQSRFGERVGIFGRGWEGIEGWQGPIPFDRQLEACREAELVVGGTAFSPARYYMSDRVFNQVVSGVPFVDLAVEGVEQLLRDGEHWHLASSIDGVVDRCDELLTRPSRERAEMGVAAAEHVLAHGTTEQRVRSMIATLTELRRSRLEGAEPLPPDLRFFLPEVDPAVEIPLATRGWDASSHAAASIRSRRPET